MKDKFFGLVDRLYLWIYSFVNGFVYRVFSRKRTRNLPSLSASEKKEIKEYWKKYRRINSSVYEYKWFKMKHKLDKRIIPESIWHADVEPHFNNVLLEKAFEDKNYYEMIVGKKTLQRQLFTVLMDNCLMIDICQSIRTALRNM